MGISLTKRRTIKGHGILVKRPKGLRKEVRAPLPILFFGNSEVREERAEVVVTLPAPSAANQR